MLNAGDYDEFCSEFYTVEKTIEVVVTLGGEGRRIRIEALRARQSPKYSTAAYIAENVTVQPTYPSANGEFSRKPENFTVWVSYDLPWTDRDSADGALQQALSFLWDRCRR